MLVTSPLETRHWPRIAPLVDWCREELSFSPSTCRSTTMRAESKGCFVKLIALMANLIYVEDICTSNRWDRSGERYLEVTRTSFAYGEITSAPLSSTVSPPTYGYAHSDQISRRWARLFFFISEWIVSGVGHERSQMDRSMHALVQTQIDEAIFYELLMGISDMSSDSSCWCRWQMHHA